MTISAALQGNFRIKYGPWIDALPEINSMAEALPFQPQSRRPGEKYRVPFLSGIEHGQTASRAGGLFTLNAPIGAEVPYAELDGSTIIMRAQYAWDDVYASLNGNDMSGGGDAGSYQDTMSLKMKAVGMGGSLYRDLALTYGPGATTTAASNIGVVKTTAGGTLATARDVFLTKASWIRGLWPSMKNALVDVYQSDGLTLRASDVVVQGVPNQNKTTVRFFKSGSGATMTANDIIVPKGWVGQSCIGLEAVMKTQTGALWGIADVSVIPQFRSLTFDAAGPLTRKLIRQYAAIIADNGSKKGGKLKLSGGAFAQLAEERSTTGRDTTAGGVKRQGESALVFETPAGDIAVEVWDLAKQGQALYLANSANAYRVGTTDNTMRPIKGLNEAFLTPLIDQSGCQSMMYSNQAPFVEQNWHNFLITGIVSDGDIVDA
jgi:hypothetical protein